MPQPGASPAQSSPYDEEMQDPLCDPMRDMTPVVRDDGSWSRWLECFRVTTHPQARLGMIRLGLQRTRWQDQAEAFVWYLRVANGYDYVRRSHAQMPYEDECRRVAFDAMCEAVAFAPHESRPFHLVRLHYIDSQDAITTFMKFIQSERNLPYNFLSQGNPLFEFICGFARLHWHEIRSPVESGYPKNREAFVSWLVANRPNLLRYLYRHKLFESVPLPDDQLTPEDVAVLRSCVFEDPFNAPPGAHRAMTLQHVRENGDNNTWKAVRLITRAEVRHRDAEERARPPRRKTKARRRRA